MTVPPAAQSPTCSPGRSASARSTDSPRRERSTGSPGSSIDWRANVALLALVGLASGLQLFGLAALLRQVGLPALLLMVPVVMVTPTHWGLIHEAIHGQLFASRRVGNGVARGLSIALGVPFETVRFGHLMHHRFTREPYDRPDEVDAGAPRWRVLFAYYGRLLGGLYVGEWLVPLLAFLPARFAAQRIAQAVGNEGRHGPQVQRLFANFAMDSLRRRRTRREWLASVLLYVLAFHGYGRWWPVLAGLMLLRGLWLSIADNLPHFDVDLDEPNRARNFAVGQFWGVLTLNHHLHQLHHAQPTLPWRALSRLSGSQASGSALPEAYFATALRQFRAPKRVARAGVSGSARGA